MLTCKHTLSLYVCWHEILSHVDVGTSTLGMLLLLLLLLLLC